MIDIQRRHGLTALLTLPVVLAGCGKKSVSFQGTDITGTEIGENLLLKDQFGQVKSLQDFRGKVSVVFFGFTHCPDV